MLDQFGLSRGTLDKLKKTFGNHSKIDKVILYGSRATGKHKIGSDIDLTLIAPSMSLSELLSVENEIDDLMLPYKVDLSLFHALENRDLIDHIERLGVVIFQSN